MESNPKVASNPSNASSKGSEKVPDGTANADCQIAFFPGKLVDLSFGELRKEIHP
jgi:hypothetical protein